MEIYSSYLAYKYVSSSTKSAILMDLQTRVRSEDKARAVADSFALYLIGELVGSPDAEVRRPMCGMLRELARHGTTARAAFGQLVSLLRGENLAVIEIAAETLHQIAISPEGAQAAVDANVLECVAELLSSPNARVQILTCGMLGWLARHETTVPAVLSLNPCQPLVSLLRRVSIIGENLAVIEIAAWALYRIAISPEGAQAAVDANRWTCRMLGHLASHGSTTAAVLNSKPCLQLVSLLRNTDLHVRSRALFVLCKLSEPPPGVAAIAATDILAHVPHLMESTDCKVQLQTCIILRNLARYNPGRPAVCQEL
ncbi:armadillo-type protein [Mycena leptocephala]|nr:armadillo-type protein [Mycena leptocephala]